MLLFYYLTSFILFYFPYFVQYFCQASSFSSSVQSNKVGSIGLSSSFFINHSNFPNNFLNLDSRMICSFLQTRTAIWADYTFVLFSDFTLASFVSSSANSWFFLYKLVCLYFIWFMSSVCFFLAFFIFSYSSGYSRSYNLS